MAQYHRAHFKQPLNKLIILLKLWVLTVELTSFIAKNLSLKTPNIEFLQLQFQSFAMQNYNAFTFIAFHSLTFGALRFLRKTTDN